MFIIDENYVHSQKAFNELVYEAFFKEMEELSGDDKYEVQSVKAASLPDVFEVFINHKNVQLKDAFIVAHANGREYWNQIGLTAMQVTKAIQAEIQEISRWRLISNGVNQINDAVAEEIFQRDDANMINALARRAEFVPTIEQFKMGIFSQSQTVSATFHQRGDWDQVWKVKKFKEEIFKKPTNGVIRAI
jgi:hypothetical protein